MAYFIPIQKVYEDEKSAEYEFDADAAGRGSAKVNKATGAIRVRNFSSLGEAADQVSARVRTRLRQHWEKQEYPDATSWSS